MLLEHLTALRARGHYTVAVHRSDAAPRAVPPWSSAVVDADVVCRMHQRLADVYPVEQLDVVVVGIYHQVRGRGQAPHGAARAPLAAAPCTGPQPQRPRGERPGAAGPLTRGCAYRSPPRARGALPGQLASAARGRSRYGRAPRSRYPSRPVRAGACPGPPATPSSAAPCPPARSRRSWLASRRRCCTGSRATSGCSATQCGCRLLKTTSSRTWCGRGGGGSGRGTGRAGGRGGRGVCAPRRWDRRAAGRGPGPASGACSRCLLLLGRGPAPPPRSPPA
jgi:hypothetical protein